MRLRLSIKIFLAFLLLSFTIVALMVLIMNFFAAGNFADYVNKVEMGSLSLLFDNLGDEYSKTDSWGTLRQNHRLWLKILKTSQPEEMLREHDRPRDHKRPGHKPRRRDPPPPKEQPPIFRIGQRLAVLDQEKSLVVGVPAPPSDMLLNPIVLNNKTVGWLGLLKKKDLSHPLDVHFLKEQVKAFYIIGGGILCLAAIAAFLLAKHLLAPIQQLTAGTQALTSLKFNTRIDVNTQDELGQLASDFNMMAKTIEKYEKMRRQWLSDISHELRTPLSILQGEVEALQDGVRPINSKTMNALHGEILHITRIVNDLYDLSVAETGTMSFADKPQTPVKILKETLALFKTRFIKSRLDVGHTLSEGENAIVKGDQNRMIQLFSNLLENSLRFTDSPGALRISSQQEDNVLILNFEDSPPGVPDEALDKLFDRLFRMDPSRSRKNGGSGLGLSICKNIVENHGGEIRALQSEMGGLKISIKLTISK